MWVSKKTLQLNKINTIIKCICFDCLFFLGDYLLLMTKGSCVKSLLMTCQLEGLLTRFCDWCKLFSTLINMEKVSGKISVTLCSKIQPGHGQASSQGESGLEEVCGTTYL